MISLILVATLLVATIIDACLNWFDDPSNTEPDDLSIEEQQRYLDLFGK